MKSLQSILLWGSAICAFASGIFGIEAIGWLSLPTNARAATLLDVVDARATLVRGFAASGVSPGVAPPPVAGVRVYGSWIKGDASVGEFVSPWYRAAPNSNVLVSGYPNRPGMRLQVETELPNGRIVARRVVQYDPRERWALEPVYLPRSATAFRLHAIDGGTGSRAWLGFSEPFRYEPVRQLARLEQPGVRDLYAAALLAFVIGFACSAVAWYREGVRA